jgi:uncharacterized protein (DUF1697 family)
MASRTFVALLRGINVGGNNKIAMRDLAGFFADAGARDVATYIQSGNVVFDAPKDAERIAAAVEKRIAGELGLRVPLVLRSAAELEKVARANPFLERGRDPKLLHVVFLADTPTKAQVASLDPARSPGDELVVHGRDVFVYLPNGVGRSKLTNAWFDSKLATVSTGRNWKTVLTLFDMANRP